MHGKAWERMGREDGVSPRRVEIFTEADGVAASFFLLVFRCASFLYFDLCVAVWAHMRVRACVRWACREGSRTERRIAARARLTGEERDDAEMAVQKVVIGWVRQGWEENWAGGGRGKGRCKHLAPEARGVACVPLGKGCGGGVDAEARQVVGKSMEGTWEENGEEWRRGLRQDRREVSGD